MSSTQNPISGATIDYDGLIRQSFLRIVRDLLNDAAANGLRGDHHFYIAFNTTHPDVVMPDYIRAQHPEEMTIVLQNQFWDLVVNDDFFSVKLSFKSKPEQLVVPFDALVGFLDPSVQFALQFKDSEETVAASQTDETDVLKDETPVDDDSVHGENVVTLDAFRT